MRHTRPPSRIPFPVLSRPLRRTGAALLLVAACSAGLIAGPAAASAASSTAAASSSIAGLHRAVPAKISAFSKAPAPQITGTAVIGAVLTAVPGASTPAATKTTFIWKRSGAVIAGAKGAQYTVTSADVGKKLTVTVTRSRSGYTANTKTSAGTAAAKGVAVFANCTALNRVYPHGVGKYGAVDRVAGNGKGVTTFVRSNQLYAANTKSDRDKDGIACEQR